MTAIAVERGRGRAERDQWIGAACVAVALHAGVAIALLGQTREVPPAPLPVPVFLVMLDGAVSPRPAALSAAPPPAPTEESAPNPDPAAPIAQALPDFERPDLPQAEDVLVHIPPRAPPPPPKRPAARPKPPPTSPVAQPREAAPARPVPEAQPEAWEATAPSATPSASGSPLPSPAHASVPGPPSKAELDWRARLVGHLERHKRYPAEARAYRQEGVVYVQFLMDRHGQVREARIERSSGHPLLDAEALAMLKRAAPLPALPADMIHAEIRLAFPLRFSLR